MKNQISNCCKEPVTVNTADEGTSCFMCTACGKPCDLFCEEMMKEQVSVDESIIIANLPGNSVLIHKEQYERLKRLDENVKRKIDYFKNDLRRVAVYKRDMLVKLLESLDK